MIFVKRVQISRITIIKQNLVIVKNNIQFGMVKSALIAFYQDITMKHRNNVSRVPKVKFMIYLIKFAVNVHKKGHI